MDRNTDFWSLSPAQLTRQCELIAEGGHADIDKELQGEASRLCTLWQDAQDKPDDDMDGRAGKAARRAALRKRTIEILVKLSGSG